MSASDLIARVLAREVLNQRGDPTVEADVVLSDGSLGRGTVPAGISAGASEVVQLVDDDPRRFNGKGVLGAVRNVTEIIGPAIEGMRASDQRAVDHCMIELDATQRKSRLGGNAMLAVSIACARAAAASSGVPLYRLLGGDNPYALPVPAFDVFRGGAHAHNSVDFQEFLLMPAGARTYREALEAGAAIFRVLQELVRQKGFAADPVRPQAAPLRTNREALELVADAVRQAGYALGSECFLGVDAATSELYRDGAYVLSRDDRVLSSAEMVELWSSWVAEYPIISIEDPLAEEDWDGWERLTGMIGDRVQIVGDDLFTTNPTRVQKGISRAAANAVLIKPNQIGTLTETLDAMRLARRAGWNTMVSTRSGETEDTTVCDLSVLSACGQIKTAPPTGNKHNRLLRIEEELGKAAAYAGTAPFRAYLVDGAWPSHAAREER